MKAKDLAALAALGVAGFHVYDKLNKKDEPKKKMGEGLDMTNQGAYERASRPKADESDAMNEVNPYDTEAMMPRGGKRDRVDRAAEIEAEFGPKGSGGTRSTDVGQGSSSAETTPKARLRAAEDSNSASNALAAQKAAADAKAAKAAAAAAAAAVQSDSSTGGVSRRSLESVPAPAPSQFTLPGTQSSMGALSRATRPSGSAAPASPPASGNAAMGAFSQVKAVPRNIQYATEAEKARQQAIDERNYDSDLMKNRRQSVIDTLQGIPSGIANIFKPPEQVFQNKTYVKDGKVVRYNKGGVVKKMASGGLASSKMSKPSGASRGDGIAQRGRTRGTLR